MHISVNAPAKINLTFDITGDLPGGYHSIVSLFHAITLQDVIAVNSEDSPSDEPSVLITVELVGEPGSFPLDENNLIAKAIRAFHAQTGLLKNKTLNVAVKKEIPIGAGLAGGSADAAATLVAVNAICRFALNLEELTEIAITLGADVPFLVSGCTQLGKGKGEILTPIPLEEKLSFVVVKPRQLSVSTPAAFKAYDSWLVEKGSDWKPSLDHERAIEFLQNGDLEKATSCFGNVFEPVIFDLYPGLSVIKKKLLELGCWSAQLSGSGPSIFAVVANSAMAHMVRRKLKEEETTGTLWNQHSDMGWELDCFIAESAGCGVTFNSRMQTK